ncbi:hypothetical protein HDV01_003618 [Terramyces sp. JEL0728]|nr:hypothetical protein HDV01_003618 [Terramyces sp. JEL0728]
MPRKPKETPVETEIELPIVEKTKRVVKKKVEPEQEQENSEDFEQKIIDKIVKVVATKKLPKSEKQKAHIDKLAEIRKTKKMVVIDKDEEIVKEKPKRIIRKKEPEPESESEPEPVVKKKVKRKPQPEPSESESEPEPVVKKKVVKKKIQDQKPKPKRTVKKKSPEQVQQQPQQFPLNFSFRTRRPGLIIYPTPHPTPITGTTVNLTGFSTLQMPSSNVVGEHPNRISYDYYKVYNQLDFEKGGGKKDIALANEIKEDNRKAEIKQTLFNQQNTGTLNVTNKVNNVPHINTSHSSYYSLSTTNNSSPGNPMSIDLNSNPMSIDTKSSNPINVSVLGKRKREHEEIGSNKLAKHSHRFNTNSVLGKRNETDTPNYTRRALKKVKRAHEFDTNPVLGKRSETDNFTIREFKKVKKNPRLDTESNLGKRSETDTPTLTRRPLKNVKITHERTINIPESSAPVSSRTRSQVRLLNNANHLENLERNSFHSRTLKDEGVSMNDKVSIKEFFRK